MRFTETDQDPRILQLKEDLKSFKAYYVDGLWGSIFFWRKKELLAWIELIQRTLDNADEPKLTAQEILQFVRVADGARGFSWRPSQFRRRITEYCPNPYRLNRSVDEKNKKQDALGVLAVTWKERLRGLSFPNGNKKYARRLVERLSYLDAARLQVDYFILAVSKWNNLLGSHLPKVVSREDRVHSLLVKKQPQPRARKRAVVTEEVPVEKQAEVPKPPGYYVSEAASLIAELGANKSRLQTDFNAMGTPAQHDWYMLVQLGSILQDDLRDVKYGLEKMKKGRLTRGIQGSAYSRKGKNGQFDVALIESAYSSYDQFCSDPDTAKKAASDFEHYPDKEQKEKFTSFALKYMYIEHMVNVRYRMVLSEKPGVKVKDSELYQVVLLELFYMKIGALIEVIEKVLQYIQSPKSEVADLPHLLNELKSLSNWVITLSLYTRFLDYKKELSLGRSGGVRSADFTRWFMSIRSPDIVPDGTKGVLRSAIIIQNLFKAKKMDVLQENKASVIFGHLENMLERLARSRERRSSGIEAFRVLLDEAPKAEQSAMAEAAHQGISEDPVTLYDLGLTEKAEGLDLIPYEWLWMQRTLMAIPIGRITQCDKNGLTDKGASSLLRLRAGLRPVVQSQAMLESLEEERRKKAQEEGKEHRPFSEEERKQKQRSLEQGLLYNSLVSIFTYEFHRDPDWLNRSDLDVFTIASVADFMLIKCRQEGKDTSGMGQVAQAMKLATKENSAMLREAVDLILNVVGHGAGPRLKLILGDLLIQKTDQSGEIQISTNFSKCLTRLDWINACLSRLSEMSEYQFEARLREQAGEWRDAILSALPKLKAQGRANAVFRVEDSEKGVKRIALVDHDPGARQKLIFEISQAAGVLPKGEFRPWDDKCLALEREQDIDKVHEGVLTVNEMGRDLQGLVSDQGADVKMVCDRVKTSYKVTQKSVKNIHDTLMIEKHGFFNWFLGQTPECPNSEQLVENCLAARESATRRVRGEETKLSQASGSPNKNQALPSFWSVFSLFGHKTRKATPEVCVIQEGSSCALK